jgi:hypothetical protein
VIDASDICVRLRAEVVWEADVGALLEEAAREIERLRTALARLADQDATLSVCYGNVTVTMDGTLTDAEREAICQAVTAYDGNDDDEQCAKIAATLRGLLERTK